MATFLQKAGIACIVLERRNRSYIETRQCAGVVDARTVRMFEQWNLANKLLAGPVATTIDYISPEIKPLKDQLVIDKLTRVDR